MHLVGCAVWLIGGLCSVYGAFVVDCLVVGSVCAVCVCAVFMVHLLYIVHLVVGSVCEVCVCILYSVYDRATGSVHRANKQKIEAVRTRACFSFCFFPLLFACLKIED